MFCLWSAYNTWFSMRFLHSSIQISANANMLQSSFNGSLWSSWLLNGYEQAENTSTKYGEELMMITLIVLVLLSTVGTHTMCTEVFHWHDELRMPAFPLLDKLSFRLPRHIRLIPSMPSHDDMGHCKNCGSPRDQSPSRSSKCCC